MKRIQFREVVQIELSNPPQEFIRKRPPTLVTGAIERR
jgi:hypothetical protein